MLFNRLEFDQVKYVITISKFQESKYACDVLQKETLVRSSVWLIGSFRTAGMPLELTFNAKGSKLIQGSNDFRLSTITDHEKSEAHQRA